MHLKPHILSSPILTIGNKPVPGDHESDDELASCVQPTWSKIVNAIIIKTQTINLIKFDLKGQ